MAEGVIEADSKVLNLILMPDGPPLEPLLSWLSGNSSQRGASKSLFSPSKENVGPGYWKEVLDSTAPDSFAVSFLNFVRNEVHPVLVMAEGRSTNGSILGLEDVNKIKSDEVQRIQSVEVVSKHPCIQMKFENQRQPPGTFDTSASSSGQAYEVAFPALTSQRGTSSQQPKQKRRVNPTLTTNPVVDSAFVLAKVEHSNPLEPGTKSRISSTGRVKVDMDILMQRFEKTRKQKGKENAQSDVKDGGETNTHLGSENLNSSLLKGKPNGGKSNNSIGSGSSSTKQKKASEEIAVERPPNKPLPVKLKRFAMLHSKLLLGKIVPSLCGELQLLLQLLSLEPSLVCIKNTASVPLDEDHEAEEGLFTTGDACASYACAVLDQSGQLLDCVGEQLLLALIEEPAISRHSPSLLSRLKRSLADYQSASLCSFKAYEMSSRGHGSKQKRYQAMPGMPVSLPFQSERDSRNNYRTREEQRIYNNREICRDQFYAIIRDVASSNSAFVPVEKPGFVNHEKHLEDVKQFLRVLLVENYTWFSDLFLDQVIQVSLCGETDPEVTGLARQDPSKLQKLHDRLTSTRRVQHTNASHLKGGADQGIAETQIPRSCRTPNKKYNDASLSHETMQQQMGQVNTSLQLDETKSAFESQRWRFKPFSEALRPYAWFVEAADSYRLSMQLIWSMTSKICSMSELNYPPQGSSFPISDFTERVLILKILGGMYGFICSLPGSCIHMPHEVPMSLGGFFPIDVAGILSKSIARGCLLLNLPWVLEFLYMSKINEATLSNSYFQRIICNLRHIYSLPILDPSAPEFGVGGMCVLAALDSFFEYLNSFFHINKKFAEVLPLDLLDGVKDSIDNLGVEGLDKIPGLVDARYIQQCCPMLMELRAILLKAKKHRLQLTSCLESPGFSRKRLLRKITPVEHRSEILSANVGSVSAASAMPEGNNSEILDLKLRLQRNFLDQRPHLRRLVDFIIDTAAANAARAATLKCVPAVLDEAYAQLDKVLLPLVPQERMEQSTSNDGFKISIEHIITGAIHKAFDLVAENTKVQAEKSTSEALSILVSPDESPYVISVAADLASETAGLAACNKALANISGDIRKQIMDRWETSSRKFFKRMQQESGYTNTGILKDSESPILVAGQEKVIGYNAKRQLSFSETKETEVNQLGMNNLIKTSDPAALYSKLICEKIISLCSRICGWVSVTLIDAQARQSIRQHLAAICVSLEILLTKVPRGIPEGGIDSLIVQKDKDSVSFMKADGSSAITDTPTNSLDMGVEQGLLRRSVVLALRVCLLLPLSAFGLTREGVIASDCHNPSLCCGTMQRKGLLQAYLTLLRSWPEDIENQSSVEHVSGDAICHTEVGNKCSSYVCAILDCTKHGCTCVSRDWHSGLMGSLVNMWKVLVRANTCTMDFLMKEFLAMWRWRVTLLTFPWESLDIWLVVVKHGMASVLLQMLMGASNMDELVKLIRSLLINIKCDGFFSLPSRDCFLNSREKHEKEVKKLAISLAIQLDLWQNRDPDLSIPVPLNACEALSS